MIDLTKPFRRKGTKMVACLVARLEGAKGIIVAYMIDYNHHSLGMIRDVRWTAGSYSNEEEIDKGFENVPEFPQTIYKLRATRDLLNYHCRKGEFYRTDYSELPFNIADGFELVRFKEVNRDGSEIT